MRHNILILLFSTVILNSCIIPYSPNVNNPYALKESFIENKIGWIEEKNSHHELEITNGYYFIHSKDTSFSYTSTSPLDKSFLYGLKNFELETSFDFVKKSTKETQFSIVFYSGSIRYNFILDSNGNGIVIENDDPTRNETVIAEKKIEGLNLNTSLKLKIIIKKQRFLYYVGEILVGEGDLKSGSWQEMRIHISSGTQLVINYFNILRT